MRPALTLLVGVATLLAMAVAAPSTDVSSTPSIEVPVETKYITTEVQTLDQDAQITLIGHLCKKSMGESVQVTVLLNNNPNWDTTFGVLWYYVVDDETKNSTAALCTNYPTGEPAANCSVKSWPSVNDIFIKGHAGQSAAVSFTVDVEVRPKAKVGGARIKPRPLPFVKAPIWKLASGPTTTYLSEVVTLQSAQQLPYHKTALMNFTFCPTPRTGTRYQVQAEVTAVDGKSSYALYLCDKLPCVVDGNNVIAHNGRQLPSNDVTTESGSWETLYALVVCWGGVWNPTLQEYIGKFVFTAHQV